MVNLFEGVMSQDMIELVYNRGEQDLASYDKEIPEIENSKSVKLLAKFPLNLMLNSNIERQWVKKVSVERDRSINGATFSISIKTLDYPISLKMKPYKPSYLSSINIVNNQKYKKILVENQYKYPVINVLTLKEFMSNNQTFSLIMSILQGYEENNKSTNIAIQILAHLMTKNQKFMSIFESIKGIELLKPILIEYDANNILKDEMVDLLFQILCNDVEAGKWVDPLTYIKDEYLPIIIPSRIDFLNLILHCIETLSPQNSLKFLEKLVVLIKNERNFKIFRDSLGIDAVFKIFNQEIGANKFIIHEEAITLFELFVEQMEVNKDDVIKYFDYLIGAKYIVPLNQRMEHIIVDTLSVLSVHLSIKNSQTFLEKINNYGLSTIIYGLFMYESCTITDYLLKFVCLCLDLSPKIKNNFVKYKGIEMISDYLNDRDSATIPLLQTLIDFSINKFTIPSTLFPPNSSVVHSVINKSKIGHLILTESNIKKSEENLRIIYPQVYEALFGMMSVVEQDSIKMVVTLLKKLENRLEECKDDCETLMKVNFFLWAYDYLVISNPPQSYEEGSSKGSNDSKTLISSTGEILKVKTNDTASFIETKSESEVRSQPRTHKIIYKILTLLSIEDLKNSSKQSKLFENLKKVPSSVDFIQVKIIKLIIKYLIKNHKLKEEESIDICKNLWYLFSNLNDLISFNASIILIIMKLINVLISKNSEDIRKNIMRSGLKDLRNNLLITLINTSSSFNDRIVDTLKNFNFEIVASKQEFRDNQCIAFLLKYLFTTKDKEGQEHCLNVLINEISRKEENIKPIKECLKPYPQLIKFVTMQQQIDFNDNPSSSIRKEMPSDPEELEKWFEDLDNEDVPIVLFLQLINTQKEGLLKPLIEKLSKITKPIESSIHEESIKSFEKRSKNRMK